MRKCSSCGNKAKIALMGMCDPCAKVTMKSVLTGISGALKVMPVPLETQLATSPIGAMTHTMIQDAAETLVRRHDESAARTQLAVTMDNQAETQTQDPMGLAVDSVAAAACFLEDLVNFYAPEERAASLAATQLQTAPIGAMTNARIHDLDNVEIGAPKLPWDGVTQEEYHARTSWMPFGSIMLTQEKLSAINDCLQGVEAMIQEIYNNASSMEGPNDAEIVPMVIGMQDRIGKIKSLLSMGSQHV